MKRRDPPRGSGQLRSHPRRIRRGLIEAVRQARRQPGRLDPIPGEFAGASLKHGVVARPVVRDARDHPRRIRRGLIEALPVRARRAAGPRPIPGEFAGASLKRRVLRHRGRRARAHPRRIRRGLIEAARPSRAGRRASGPPIPGEFAGASLKRFAWLSAWRFRLPGHPRRIRRGLIEAPWVPFVCAACGTPHPRRIRRGLIEAWGSAAELAGADCGTHPRRIRRGLIEATITSLSRRMASTAPIPGEFAGASLKRRGGRTPGSRSSTSPSPANSPGPH